MLHRLPKQNINPIFKAHADDCSVSLITHETLPNFISLHRDIYWNQDDNQKHFYKWVLHTQLAKSLKAGNQIIGLTAPDGETLLAGARLTLGTTLAKETVQNFELDAPVINAANTCLIQTLGVHPLTNGHGGKLTTKLFAAIEQQAQIMGQDWVVGKLSYGNKDDSLNNKASFAAFKRNGYVTFYPPSQMTGDNYTSIRMVRHVGKKSGFSL